MSSPSANHRPPTPGSCTTPHPSSIMGIPCKHLRGWVSSLLHPVRHNVHHASSRLRPFDWVHNSLFVKPGGEDIELRERRSAAVDVSYRTQHRNASARERPMAIIPFKSKNPAASTSSSANDDDLQVRLRSSHLLNSLILM